MTNHNNFEKLPKASLHDLKMLKIIKSVSVYKNEFDQSIAILEDYNSNIIEVMIGFKSSQHLPHEIALTQTLEDSAYIVLINEAEKILRLTTSEYSSNGYLREIFGIPMDNQENKELMHIKEILGEKGLKI